MMVEINKIKVNDRIRKDFGDIDELASNIKEHSLLNPVTVMAKNDGTYLLLAGERRLRACKKLGYTTIAVNTVSAESAEKELMIEISENECRKEFTMTERLRFAEKLQEIEAEKAAKRRRATQNNNAARADVENFPPQGSVGKTRDIVAKKLNMGSGRQYEKQLDIVKNQSLLSPEDFANWDHNKLSTNKAYQKIVAEKKRIEEENERLKQDAENTKLLINMIPELEDLLDTGVVTKDTLLGIMRNLDEEDKKEFLNSINASDKNLEEQITSLQKELEKSEQEKRLLEDQVKMDQHKLDTCRMEGLKYETDANHYQVLEKAMIDVIRDQDQNPREKLRMFYSNIDLFIKTRLAPSLYDDGREILITDENMRNNFKKIIDRVQLWTNDAYKFIGENNYVEVE